MSIPVGKTLIVLVISVAAYYYKTPIGAYLNGYLNNEVKNDITEALIAKSWQESLSKMEDNENRFSEIIIGINSGIDVIISGSQLLKELGTTREIENAVAPRDHRELNSVDELRESFSFFQSKGAGGERFMDNPKLFSEIVAMAKKMEGVELYVGGNGALMAQTLSRLAPDKTRIYFNGPVGPALSPMLNSRIIVPDNVKVDNDEYHMILEYAKDEVWAGRSAPIASRFIFSHDMTNGKMLAFENFIHSVKQASPDLVIFGGFHLLEAQGPNFWKQRIKQMAKGLKELPHGVPIHIELASMAVAEFVKEISDSIFPLVHSIGLNEQELWLVCLVNDGPHCRGTGAENTSNPGVSSDIIYWMLDRFSKRQNPSSLLTRIHFHTLPYHIVTTLESSRWRYMDTSVIGGAQIASTQSCGDITVQPKKVELRLPTILNLSAGGLPTDCDQPEDITFNPTKPVVSWVVKGLNFSMTPVLVCRKPVKTVGLGDAISSTGLLYSGYAQET